MMWEGKWIQSFSNVLEKLCPVICLTMYYFPLCVVQWKREQDFDLQLLERAVQGEEAQAVRSVQGEERPPEHKERPRSHSDEWLTLCSTATTPPAHEVDLEPLDYDLDLNKEVRYLLQAKSYSFVVWNQYMHAYDKGRRRHMILNQEQPQSKKYIKRWMTKFVPFIPLLRSGPGSWITISI